MTGPLPTDLLRILGLLYRQNDDDVFQLELQLLDQRKVAWRSSIQREARRLGYTGPAEGPRHQDLAYLKDLCQQDARSIVNTWNRDVERQLLKLFAANPKGNRRYYAKHMEAWAQARSMWKDRQIITQTEYTVVAYAKERFWQENGLRGGRYKFDGPPPVCGDCLQHFSAGVVSQAYVDRHPTPIHIGCPHTWTLLKGSVPSPSPGELWLG